MNRPHPTADDLRVAKLRFESEAKSLSFVSPRYRLRYTDWGSGPAIVMVHGLCDMPRSFALLMAELVDRGYRCLCYDLANGKDDDAKLDTYSHLEFVEDLMALLDHLNLVQVDVKGSSFGSTITLQSLLRYPARFRKVVLQGGFAYRKINVFERTLSRLGRSWPWRMKDMPARKVIMGQLERGQFVNCPAELYDFLTECSGETPLSAAAHRALILSELDLRPQLKDIPHPILMIGGDRDTIVPREFERTVEEGAPHVQRIEFSPCGHYPQYTMPVQMAEAMDTFLR